LARSEADLFGGKDASEDPDWLADRHTRTTARGTGSRRAGNGHPDQHESGKRVALEQRLERTVALKGDVLFIDPSSATQSGDTRKSLIALMFLVFMLHIAG
jgi:hypothetical protein